MIPFSRPSEWRYLEGDCHQIGHTWIRSCFLANVGLVLIVTYEGFKIYLPLYVVSTLLRTRSLRECVKVLPFVLRSAVFLGSNVGGALFFICLLRRLIGRFYLYSSIFLPCFLGAGFAILVERKSRRPLLSGYVATVATDMMYCVLKDRKLISPLPYGEVLIFSMATAVLFYKYRSHSTGNDLVSAILRGLLTPKLPAFITRTFQSSPLDNRLTHIVMVGVWAFLLGYLLQTLLTILSQRTRIFTEKGRLKATLTNHNTVKFSAFLSSLALGCKVVNSILYCLNCPRDLRLLLAGLTAGLSMLFFRSRSLALYVGWKALEVVYSWGVAWGWLKYLPYGEVFIYALSTGCLFHGWFFEGHNMRWSYWNFLLRITQGHLNLIKYSELNKFGTNSSKRYEEWKRRTEITHET